MINFIEEIKNTFKIDRVYQKGNFLIVEKFNWNYLECLKFQESCADFIYRDENKETNVIIYTNHPTCLTLGRGLQKKISDPIELVDFNDKQKEKLSIPLYKIKRGGGITFHHPGQIVIYPIINLTTQNLKVYDLMSNIMRVTVKVLKNYGVESKLDYCRDLLGLWHDEKKNSEYWSSG